MKQVVIRALPFLITFALGVAVAAIFGAVLPRHSKWERGCSKKYKTTLRMGSVSRSDNTFVITRIHKSGETRASWVSKESTLTRTEEENTLVFDTMTRPGCCGHSDFAISYGAPKAIDGQPVTSDAVLTNIPRPRFWANERHASRVPGCNAMLRVDLQASGTVAIAEKVERYTDSCQYIDDILDAARNITFQPALRDGIPVTEQVTILYTLR
jgi:hypothetical protein